MSPAGEQGSPLAQIQTTYSLTFMSFPRPPVKYLVSHSLALVIVSVNNFSCLEALRSESKNVSREYADSVGAGVKIMISTGVELGCTILAAFAGLGRITNVQFLSRPHLPVSSAVSVAGRFQSLGLTDNVSTWRPGNDNQPCPHVMALCQYFRRTKPRRQLQSRGPPVRIQRK